MALIPQSPHESLLNGGVTSALSNLLSNLSAHGYSATRLEIPGVLVVDLTAAPVEPLSPGERRALEAATTPGSRSAEVLRLPFGAQ